MTTLAAFHKDNEARYGGQYLSAGDGLADRPCHPGHVCGVSQEKISFQNRRTQTARGMKKGLLATVRDPSEPNTDRLVDYPTFETVTHVALSNLQNDKPFLDTAPREFRIGRNRVHIGKVLLCVLLNHPSEVLTCFRPMLASAANRLH